MTQSEIVRRIDEICHEFDSRLVSGVTTPVARLELAKALAETESALGDVLIKHNASLDALEQLRAELAAAYALIDHVEEFIVLSAFDNDEYHFYRDYKKARDFGG